MQDQIWKNLILYSTMLSITLSCVGMQLICLGTLHLQDIKNTEIYSWSYDLVALNNEIATVQHDLPLYKHLYIRADIDTMIFF